MTARERFLKTMNFEKVDRLPMLEWATWWDKTVDRWKGEGNQDIHRFGRRYFHGAGLVCPRREFERLLPVMRQGGFAPSVDHQTPPGVSYENYRIYLKLFREYAEMV